jgi:hypothetical protein
MSKDKLQDTIFIVGCDRYDLEHQVMCHRTFQPNGAAELAMRLAERWGMVAVIPDGVDDAGRQKLRLMTPDEIVERATSTAEAIYLKMHDKGWMVDVPAPVLSERGQAKQAAALEARKAIGQKPVININEDFDEFPGGK